MVVGRVSSCLFPRKCWRLCRQSAERVYRRLNPACGCGASNRAVPIRQPCGRLVHRGSLGLRERCVPRGAEMTTIRVSPRLRCTPASSRSFDAPGKPFPKAAAVVAARPLRNATAPVSVSLGGYNGKYLEWSVPNDRLGIETRASTSTLLNVPALVPSLPTTSAPSRKSDSCGTETDQASDRSSTGSDGLTPGHQTSFAR
jgi:hypothetical protein